MNKRKKVDMSKLCLKSKPSIGVPNQISQFFQPNQASTSSSTEISRPLVESVKIHSDNHAVLSIADTLKTFEHTKDKMERLAKRKIDLSSNSIATFFDPASNVSLMDFELPKRPKLNVTKSVPQPKLKRSTNTNRSKQKNIKQLLANNKTEEGLFSELLAQQCVTENVHPDELQMALALSKSLVETFNQGPPNESTRAKSPESRFSDIQKTLENFGFKSAGNYDSANDMKTILRFSKNYKWRRKFCKRNLDYIRKPFEEKYSMIFTDTNKHISFDESNEYAVSSKMLQEMRRCPKNTFFKIQSSDVHSSKLMNRYYSSNMFEVNSVRSDFLLKNWDEIPGRTPSPVRRQKFDLSKITDLSDDLSQKFLEYPEYESDSEIVELHEQKPVDIPLLTRTCSRDVESPDLFSDSEEETDKKDKPLPEICNFFESDKIIENDSDKSGITHFENYTSEEAKIKDVVASKLCESNDDIFADLSVDMVDLTSECESIEEEISKSSLEQRISVVSQEESAFTLSSETCDLEIVRSKTPNAIETEEITTLTELDTVLTNIRIVCESDSSIHSCIRNEDDLLNSNQLNTQDISLVYSDDEQANETESQLNQDSVSTSIVILSDDSDDEDKTMQLSPHPQTKLPTFNAQSVSENNEVDVTMNILQNDPLLSSSPCNEITQIVLTETDDLSGIVNQATDENVNVSHSSNNNDTQNITLAFSDDEVDDENQDLGHEKYPLARNISPNNFKTPPRHNSVINFSQMELPYFPNQTDDLENLKQNISDSIEISDDEINYSTAQLNQITPTKTPEKSIDIDSDDDLDLPEDGSSLLGKSMHSFLQRYEKQLSEDVNVVEDGNNENNEVNKSVNEFLFKSRFDSQEKFRSAISTSKSLKRYPSEPSFNRSVNKTPKKLCFDLLKKDDEFDKLVFGEKINHDIVLGDTLDSPLREIPKSPEPPVDDDFEELNCPFNYFQPDDEYDIVLNQNTPKVNLNGTIDLNETLYEGEKYIYKTRNVTPEPEYNKMELGMLHVELKKYGLKKISRPKAIKLLEYIYNETHPIIQDPDKELINDDDHHKIASSQPVKQTIRSPTKNVELPTTTTTQIVGTWSGIDFSACDSDTDYFKQDNFTLNLLNCNEMIYLPSKPRSGKLQYCSLPLHIAFFNLFRSNSKLRNAIFLYQPLEVEKIYSYFKSVGVKYEMNDLISFFDRHCITFRTEPKKKTNGGRTKK